MEKRGVKRKNVAQADLPLRFTFHESLCFIFDVSVLSLPFVFLNIQLTLFFDDNDVHFLRKLLYFHPLSKHAPHESVQKGVTNSKRKIKKEA